MSWKLANSGFFEAPGGRNRRSGGLGLVAAGFVDGEPGRTSGVPMNSVEILSEPSRKSDE